MPSGCLLGEPVKFLISVIDTATGTATRAEIDDIDRFNEQLRADGEWIMACGLADPSDANVIDGRHDLPVVESGPLHSTTEFVSGFWIIDVATADVAHGRAVEASRACGRRVELRSMLGG